MKRKIQRGISLVEIMVALIAGLILTGGMIQIYASNHQTYRVADASARIQENARLALELLARDIRMAGYQGCAGRARAVVNTLNDTSSFLYDFDTAIQGFEATSPTTWTPTVDPSITSPLGGRDIVAVRGVFGEEGTIRGQLSSLDYCTNASSSTALEVSTTNGLNAGDTAIASNCSYASIVQITEVDTEENVVCIAGSVTPDNDTLAKITTRTFYIRENPAGIPALYRKDGTAGAEELVEGVENMQILYGLDSDGDGKTDQFVRANDVLDWDRVASVRISLLLQSIEDHLTTAPQSYTFNGATVTPADRRLRRVFTTTIGLRNRLP